MLSNDLINWLSLSMVNIVPTTIRCVIYEIRTETPVAYGV